MTPNNAASQKHPVRVFVVEDSAVLRHRLMETLDAWGDIEIVGHAGTEAAAEVALKTQEWDVLVLDLQLLHGSGLGVLQSLSDYRKTERVVIVLTNYSIPLYRTRALQLGADYFFDKGCEFSKIRDVLIEYSEKRS